jgi:hypothetical protein
MCRCRTSLIRGTKKGHGKISWPNPIGKHIQVLQQNRTQSSRALGRAERQFMTHLYGPAARCKPKMMIWRTLVLRFCIRPVDGAFELLAIMDIRARSISFASRPRRPYGSPDHERAGETFSPSPLSNSQTSAGSQHLLPGLA